MLNIFCYKNNLYFFSIIIISSGNYNAQMLRHSGQDCRLKVVKNGFANFGYGFALSKDSIYAEEITINIYLLRESGYMDALDNKW